MLAALDLAVFHFFNNFIGKWPLFDKGVHALADDLFLRGTVIFFLLWSAWFIDRSTKNRAILLCGLLGTCVATLLSVFMQHKLMIHVRPLLDAQLLKQISPVVDLSLWMTPDSLRHLNSFPSDTATMYFALAFAIAGSNKRFGMAAIAWVLVVIALPRIYLAYHYPSDILGGFVLALAVQTVSMRVRAIRSAAEKIVLAFGDKEYLLQPLMFVIVADMSNLFVGVRHALRSVPVVIGLLYSTTPSPAAVGVAPPDARPDTVLTSTPLKNTAAEAAAQ